MNKKSILEWCCATSKDDGNCNGEFESGCILPNEGRCPDYLKLSALLDKMIESAPSEKNSWNTAGYLYYCDKVAERKTKMKEGV